MYYKIDENKNVLPSSLEEWETFRKDENSFPRNLMRVGETIIKEIRVSTVFFGISDFENPKLFETMVFNKDGNGIYTRRCFTFNEAEKMHDEAVHWVLDGCKDG